MMRRAVALAVVAAIMALAGFGAGYLSGHDAGWRQGKAWGILVGMSACLDVHQPEAKPGTAL